MLVEQFGKLFGHGAAEFLGVDDRDGAAVVPRNVVTDADRDQFNGGARLDLLDHPAQMPFKIVAGVHRQSRIIDWGAIGDHHQDLALFAPAQQSLMCPIERFAVDVLLEQSLAHHEPEILACATPGRIARLVDDVPQIVEPPRIGRLAGGEPRLARLPALPCARGKAENLHFHTAALERAREDVRARGCDRDRAPAH